MTPERFSEIRKIFEEASEMDVPLRAAYLERACAGDAVLRTSVEQLLKKHAQSGLFLDWPPVSLGKLLVMADGAFAVGEVIGERFRIESVLGEGGMGQVFRAYDSELRTPVAVKVVRRELAASPEYSGRFRREIQLARQVTHPNVCRVYDAGRHDGVPYFTMELLDGESLSTLLERSGRLTAEQAWPLIRQMCDGMAAAHQAGILHRDFKPANVMLAGDRAVLMDFGLARLGPEPSEESGSQGQTMGTPAYMSPEQIEGKRLSPASDIYSLGLVMYEMLSGCKPHDAPSPLAMAVKKVRDAPPPLKPLQALPASWEPAILKCLEYDPERRFSSARDLFEALESPAGHVESATAAAQDSDGRARVSLAPESVEVKDGHLSVNPTQADAPPRPHRSWKPIVAAAVLLVACAAGGWWVWQHQSPAPLSPEVKRLYTEGVTALSDGANAKAARLLEAAARAAPGLASAHARLAEAYQELDMRDRAQEELLQALGSKTRDTEERLLVQGVQGAITGNWDTALESARKREATDRLTATLDKGRWLERAGKAKEAIAAYQEILTWDRSQPGALLRLSDLLAQQGKVPEASALLDRAQAAYQTLSSAEGLGSVALARAFIAKTVPDAIAFEQEAEKRGREASSDLLIVRAIRARAESVQQLGHADEGRALALTAIAAAEHAGLFAEAVNARIELGVVPLQSGKFEAAEKDFLEALEMASRFKTLRAQARGKLALGQLYRNTNRLKEAAQPMRDAIAYYKSIGDLGLASQGLCFLAGVEQLGGHVDAARASYEEADRISSAPEDHLRVMLGSARLAASEGRRGESSKIFQKVVSAYESMGNKLYAQTYRVRLSLDYTDVGRFAESQKELDHVAADRPANASVAFALEMATASLEYQQMKTDQAIRRIEQLRSKAKQDGNLDRDREARSQLCAKYALADDTVHAGPLCEQLETELANRKTSLGVVKASLSMVALKKGDASAAVRYAREAVQIATDAKQLDNLLWNTMVLTMAQHRAHDPLWAASRKRSRELLAELRKLDTETAEGYRRRPVQARLVQSVEALR